MLHKSVPQKPPIAQKPKVAQKTNYIIVGRAENQSQVSSSRNGNKTNNEQYSDHQPLLLTKAQRDANFITLPSSPPNYSDCTNDCCGILNNKHLDCIQRQKNNKNGTHLNGGSEEKNGSSFHHNNDSHKSAMGRNFETSSQSFDSLSSSSGGFKDVDYVTKTRVAYESYDKEDNCIVNNQTDVPEIPAFQMPIGHSKVQEMKSKLFAQQKQQQNHSNNEASIPITRQHIQKSSKELEKVLGLRIEKDVRQKISSQPSHEKMVKRLSKSFDDAQENNVATISNQIGANISKHIQQKLTEEMKQQCEIIKEKFLIEKIPVQQHYKDFMVQIRAKATARFDCLSMSFPIFFYHWLFMRPLVPSGDFFSLFMFETNSRPQVIESIFFSYPITE